MKKFYMTAIILIQILASCKNAEGQTFAHNGNIIKELVIKNVSIVSMKADAVLENQDILIRNGKIISITDTGEKEFSNVMKIDGSNKFLIPSLADAHVHLPEREEDLNKFFILNLINGVTKLRSMRGALEHLEWRNKYNTKTSIYPKLYLSGPPISRTYDFTMEQLEAYVKKTKDFDFIKILSIKNESLFKELDSLCKMNDITIGGHFPGNISEDLLFKSNYTSFEHLDGLTELSELVENRIQKIKENNIFICPTLSWYNIGSGRYSYEELRSQSGMQFVPKTIIDDWIEKTKQYREDLGYDAYRTEVESELKKLENKYQIIKRLDQVGVKMLLSPDSSSKYMVPGFGILEEMKLLKNSELSNYEILKMATINFADFFGENYGVIVEGKDADFIILGSNPLSDLDALKSIEGLYFNANYLDKDALDNLSKSILPN